MKKSILNYIDAIPFSLENDVMPTLICNQEVFAYPYNGYFIDIGIPEDLEKAKLEIPTMKRPACFFDRDGVINLDNGYVHRSEDVEWIQDAVKAIKYLNDKGYYVIVVTNQAGVARGYYSEEQVKVLHKWINNELSQYGAHIDSFYYCPHHPIAGIGNYLQKCGCRKPEPGMLLDAMKEYSIDVNNSFLIGDMDHDVLAAQSAGIKGYKYIGGSLLQFVKGHVKLNKER